MIQIGYPYLVAGDFPGGENRMAEPLEFLRSLGISIIPRGGTTRRQLPAESRPFGWPVNTISWSSNASRNSACRTKSTKD